MTAVCSVGIDMVVIPGDTPAQVISALIADEAAIGMVNSKTTAVWVILAIGRKAGEELDFGAFGLRAHHAHQHLQPLGSSGGAGASPPWALKN